MERMNSVLGIYSGGIWRIPYLDSFCPASVSDFRLLSHPGQCQRYRRLGLSPERAKTGCAGEAAGLPSFALKMVYSFVGLVFRTVPFHCC
jgi:capsular polysaccharide export protein